MDTHGVVGGTAGVRQKELERREREHTELMNRLMKEREQYEEEIMEFEKMVEELKKEEKTVEEERRRLGEEGKRVMKDRKRLETQLRLIQHNSVGRQKDLKFVTSQEK